jgi:hypothetical protein
MFCPNFKNKEVSEDFNKIVESLGGQPMSKSEFISKSLRAERYGRNKFAMNAAYYLWDLYQGDMQQIAMDKDFLENKRNEIIPTPEITETVESIVEQPVEEILPYQPETIRGEEINFNERNIRGYNESLENVPKIFPSEENVSNNKEELKKVTSQSEQELLKSFSQEQINEFVENFDSYYPAYSQSIFGREDRIIFINKVISGEYKIIC